MTSIPTPEQIRAEQNRKLALERRAARLAQISQSNSQRNLPLINRNAPVYNSSVNITGTCLEAQRSSILHGKSTDVGLQRTKIPCNTSSLDYNYVGPSSNSNSLPRSSMEQTPRCSLDITKTKTQDKNNLKFSMKQNTSHPTLAVSKFQVNKPNPINGMFKLISKNRFTVDIPYQQQIVDLFKDINGREYDSKTKLWTFPVTEYFNLKRTVSPLKPHILIADLPKCIVETFITKTKIHQQDPSKIDISRVDEKLRQTIYPFQKEGIQYGVSKGGRCLLADDMGLGKSIQALGIADYYRSDWPLLVVCPSSMRYQWEEEIRINLPNSVHTHQVFVMTTGKDNVEGARVLITSYDLLAKKRELIKEMGFGVVILDESHSIKSIKTQRGKAALEVTEQCKRVILLSGTPVLSRPAELHTQIKAIDPTIFPYFKEYGMRYCGGMETKFGWNFSGSSNMEELGILLEARFMIRRLKSNVLTQLPSKIRQVVVLKSQSLKKTSESMEAFALKLQSSSLRGSERHGTLLAYFSETAKNKASAVCEYITDLLQDNRKFLVFAHHAEMLDAVSETLEKNECFYIRIDGSVSAEDRKSLSDKFQFEEKWKVAVLSIKAANTGLTLTAAQVVVFAELFWNPGDLAQAEDRAHRIGQEDCVVIKYLIAKGTADDHMWPLIQAKLEVLNKAGLSKESRMTADTHHQTERGEKKETQTKIDNYMQKMLHDENDDDLIRLMDEIDGIQEKRIKLDHDN